MKAFSAVDANYRAAIAVVAHRWAGVLFRDGGRCRFWLQRNHVMAGDGVGF